MAYNSRRQRVHNAYYQPEAYKIDVLPDEKNIKRKYSNSEIVEFFNMLKNDAKLSNYLPLMCSNPRIGPIRVTDFKTYPKDIVEGLTTDKFNARLYLAGGSVYENWQRSKEDMVTDEMRIERAKKTVPDVLKRIQELIDKADNQLFRNLKVEAVNKDYWLVCVYRDRGDDGDDYYGVPLYLKITFK
jgi:hypothetical protein